MATVGSTRRTHTFSASGLSPEITGRGFDFTFNFAGTASIDIELKDPAGVWFKIPTSGSVTLPVTADALVSVDFQTTQTLRLNNTAGAGPVVCGMSSV